MTVQEDTGSVNPRPSLTAALEYARAGMSVIPVKCDGTKEPPVQWKSWQSRIADETTIRGWYTGCEWGVGIVCGLASGGLEVIDIDDYRYWPSFHDEVEARFPGLLARLPVVATPRPGRHVYYRCDSIAGNLDLAFAAKEDGTRGKALIQTRGVGGYVVAPGSPGACHPSGGQYLQSSGPPITETPLITPEEREALLTAARCLTQWVAPARVHQPLDRQEIGGERPGDDFNARAEWGDILSRHGWQFVCERDGIAHWTRPGKDRGTSATTGLGEDLLYVFSSNAAPFEANRAYSKFAAHAMLEHEGDFGAAARDLAAQGFGGGSLFVNSSSFVNEVAPMSLPNDPQRPEPIGEDAYHGVVGRIVRLIAPHSETSPAAVMLQLLVAAGNAIGRNAFMMAEADEHYCNLFMCLVGQSSKARKGTSWGHVERLLKSVDPEWASNRIKKGGLASGEGLVHAVRDANYGSQHLVGSGVPEDLDNSDFDPGVTDKRLLVVESEFASVLKVCAKPGNTLSPFLRQAWDRGEFANLSKGSPQAATGAHISVIGHITGAELGRDIADVDMFNGFANRFLWVCSHRTQLLPEGGSIDYSDAAARSLVDEFARVVRAAQARAPYQVHRADEAKSLWRDIYYELAEEADGLAGAATSRGEAQVLRLALLYAVLDGDSMIRVSHLTAAMAVWRYCDASARKLFADHSGDRVEQRILTELARAGEVGLKRTDLYAAFHNNVNAERLGAALKSLEDSGRAHCHSEPTQGRAAERWFGGPSLTKEDEFTKEGAAQVVPRMQGVVDDATGCEQA